MKVLARRETMMLIICDRGEVLLEKRPPTGIWGGLWCFPEMPVGGDAEEFCGRHWNMHVMPEKPLPVLSHGFTHFLLDITPQPVQVRNRPQGVAEPGQIWLHPEDALQAAIPAPVRKLLSSMSAGPLFKAVSPRDT